jgi:acyl-CoA synthetase (NDP forming)
MATSTLAPPVPGRPEPRQAGALDAVLRPRSVAVIGASRSRDSIGHQILDNLVRSGFTGPVYPINPNASAVRSIRAYPSIGAVGEPVDLAVIVVPQDRVLAVAEQSRRRCRRTGTWPSCHSRAPWG